MLKLLMYYGIDHKRLMTQEEEGFHNYSLKYDKDVTPLVIISLLFLLLKEGSIHAKG
jgi:hypothetical protein